MLDLRLRLCSLICFNYVSSQVRESLGRPGDSGPHAKATVACFLIQEGANFFVTNNKGQTPLEVALSEVVTVVMAFNDRLMLNR